MSLELTLRSSQSSRQGRVFQAVGAAWARLEPHGNAEPACGERLVLVDGAKAGTGLGEVANLLPG